MGKFLKDLVSLCKLSLHTKNISHTLLSFNGLFQKVPLIVVLNKSLLHSSLSPLGVCLHSLWNMRQGTQVARNNNSGLLHHYSCSFYLCNIFSFQKENDKERERQAERAPICWFT